MQGQELQQRFWPVMMGVSSLTLHLAGIRGSLQPGDVPGCPIPRNIDQPVSLCLFIPGTHGERWHRRKVTGLQERSLQSVEAGAGTAAGLDRER